MSQPSFFAPIKKTVSILVVDDDPCQLDYYADMLSGHPLLSATTCSTAVDAERIICSGNKQSLCILDLGIDDIGNDEFYLLKKYSHRIPFIIISGTADMERAFKASKLGAAGMVAKPPVMDSPEFWNKLRDVFLAGVILPDTSGGVTPLIGECCRVLNNALPESVSNWAHQVGITDTYLRKLWTECYRIQPKHLLFIYKFYRTAFDYFNRVYIAEINEDKAQDITIDVSEHNRRIAYYMQNRIILEAIVGI